MVVRITDEFNTVWSFETDSAEEASQLVFDWLKNRDETPIYDITIEI